jgi:hypothetical protein
VPGQIANYTRNFSKIIDYINPYLSVLNKVLGSLGTGYSILTNLNKLDNPNASQKEKVVDIAKAVTGSVTGFIPNPVIGQIENAVIDTVSYFTDLQEGRKDAPPKPADVNTRTNPIGTGVNEVINSAPFKNYYSNYGYGYGVF